MRRSRSKSLIAAALVAASCAALGLPLPAAADPVTTAPVVLECTATIRLNDTSSGSIEGWGSCTGGGTVFHSTLAGQHHSFYCGDPLNSEISVGLKPLFGSVTTVTNQWIEKRLTAGVGTLQVTPGSGGGTGAGTTRYEASQDCTDYGYGLEVIQASWTQTVDMALPQPAPAPVGCRVAFTPGTYVASGDGRCVRGAASYDATGAAQVFVVGPSCAGSYNAPYELVAAIVSLQATGRATAAPANQVVIAARVNGGGPGDKRIVLHHLLGRDGDTGGASVLTAPGGFVCGANTTGNFRMAMTLDPPTKAQRGNLVYAGECALAILNLDCLGFVTNG